ncbi:hypothetical protein KXX11_003987, partial [Aspergillus fumigatus]
RPADQHPVHQRHHRLPQGRDADPPQHPQQRLLHRRGHEAHARGPAVHPGAALPLLRHGAGQPGLPDPRRHHRLPERRLRCPQRAAGGAGREMHRPAWRAHHVHRRARPPPFRRVRPVHAAHRHHGRLAVSDRGHEAGRGRHAPVPDHHRLRHDRDQPCELPEQHRHAARKARIYRGP